jgi:hypothetical protein
MIKLFSSNFIVLPNLPSLANGESGGPVAIPEKRGIADEPCSKEMNRWIARWETEGGAIVRESAQNHLTQHQERTTCLAEKIKRTRSDS